MTFRKIDTHSHIIPPEYRKALTENGHEFPDGMPGIPPWTVEDHLKLMDELNITKSIISISSPGTHLVVGNDALAAEVARSCNSYCSQLKRKYPDRFGYFASLPLPAVAESLKEIDLAESEGADGFVVMTNGHGHYLGSTLSDPIFDELNKIKAVVFIHPTRPCIACTTPSGAPTAIHATPLSSEHRLPLYEFFFDTARAITNLFTSGTMARCPDIKFIFPHAGGTFPPLFSRVSGYSQIVPGGRKMSEAEVRSALLKQCYFDLAGWVFADEPAAGGQLIALMKGVGISHERLLFGTDYCYTQAPYARYFTEVIDNKTSELFTEEEAKAILSENAIQLFQKT